MNTAAALLAYSARLTKATDRHAANPANRDEMAPFHAAESRALSRRAALRQLARDLGLKKSFPRAGWAWDLDAAAKIANA